MPERPATDGTAWNTSTAFVFGSSVSHRLRLAVANAIGGEYAMLGFSLGLFADPELLQLLSADNDARISFDESAPQVLKPSMNNPLSN